MITGLLTRAEMFINATTGEVTLAAIVDLQDDVLGALGARQHVVVDPVVVTQVIGFVDAMLPERLQFLKIANSLDTIVSLEDTFDEPVKEFELHRLAPMMKAMLPPPT